MRSVSTGSRSMSVVPSGSISRTCGPLPRSTTTRVGCAGRVPSDGVSARPSTRARRGSVSVTVGYVPARDSTASGDAVQLVRSSPSVRANAEPRASVTSDAPRARGRPSRASRSSSAEPGRPRTHSSGVTAVPCGTDRVRWNASTSSGSMPTPPAQRTRSGVSMQAARPGSSCARDHPVTSTPGSGAGRTVRCSMRIGVGAAGSEKSVSRRSARPNWAPRDPSSVCVAVMRTNVVRPAGSETTTGSPGSVMRAADVPVSVAISTHLTGEPSEPAVVRNSSSPDVSGVSGRSSSHCPTALSRPLLIHPVAGSPSTAAAGFAPGNAPPNWVASEAEEDTETRAPRQDPVTGGVGPAG